jgi:hypothetical protein
MHFWDFENSLPSGKPEIAYRSIPVLLIKMSLLNNLVQWSAGLPVCRSPSLPVCHSAIVPVYQSVFCLPDYSYSWACLSVSGETFWKTLKGHAWRLIATEWWKLYMDYGEKERKMYHTSKPHSALSPPTKKLPRRIEVDEAHTYKSTNRGLFTTFHFRHYFWKGPLS